jgi:hypothetical protein
MILDGELPGIIKFSLSMVDIEDAALAHVLALEVRFASA